MAKVRSYRRVGWLPWHEADTFAFCRAFRALLEAVETDGLIRFAVIQLVRNAGTQSQAASQTWFGRLRKRVRIVWPGFNVLVREEIVDSESVEILELIGIPNDCMTASIYPKFTSDCLFAQLCIRTWHARQKEVWNMRPSVSQQDFILYAILCSVSSRGKLLDYPLIPYWPDASYIPELVCFLRV